MACRAAPAVRALSLEVLAGQIDGALRAERRDVSGGIPKWLAIFDGGLEILHFGHLASPPPQGEQQDDGCGPNEHIGCVQRHDNLSPRRPGLGGRLTIGNGFEGGLWRKAALKRIS